jgi:carboxyl-terminal processing protease
MAAARSATMKTVLALGLLWIARMHGAAAEAPADPLEPEFQLFFNAHAEIVDLCVYRPTGRAVIVGALRELSRALGPAFSGFFPAERDVPADLGGAFVAYRRTIRALAESAPGRSGGWSTRRLVEKSLDAYCRSLDPYSEYTEAAVAQRLAALRKPDYVGIGVTIRRLARRHLCTPFPGGAADRAGLLEGDELLAIDRQPTTAMTLLEVASRLEGVAGTAVELQVRPAKGAAETLTITREPISATPLTQYAVGDGVRVTMRRINERATEDLRLVLRALGPDRPLTLDLRGCFGGEFNAAARMAEYFLPEGTVIARLETTRGLEKKVSGNRAPYRPSRLILLQDETTASGAEMIITALLGYAPLKAESRGAKTYGKGVTTQPVEVVGGGVLTITDSRMYGPNDEVWDGEGREPSSGAPVDAP